jgi:hypothetical protein
MSQRDEAMGERVAKGYRVYARLLESPSASPSTPAGGVDEPARLPKQE